jgi:hypothetical protein
MEYLHLYSDSSNFSLDGNKLKWDLPNLEFSQNAEISISEATFILKRKSKSKFIYLTTNLINADDSNPDGVILTKGIDNFRIDYNPNNLIFWPIDYQRPRIVFFGINGLEASDLSFITILVCIRNAPRVMVSIF